MSMHTPSQPTPVNWMHEPLAVVGMACRLPGADDLQSFWKMLQSGAHGIGRFPDSFVDRDLYLTNQKGVRGKSYSDVGGLISERPIDWSIMPLAPSQAEQWDPCHLILCEVAANACLQAGYDPRQMPLKRAGVYIGHSGGSTRGGELAYRTLLSDYVDLLEDLPSWQQLSEPSRQVAREQLLARLRAGRPVRGADGSPSVDAGCAAGLISRALDLSGPHMSIDAACASSLVALSLGAAALHAGQIDMAIVGGASYNKFDSLILFSHAQSCSASASRPFDAAADGLISSEGYVVFVLKTLARAQADGDRIEAVIRGIGISSDGRGRSLWAPRKEGQATAIERAYSPAVTADSVQMVEAHATSTQVGDATEMEALASFFKERLPPGKRIPVGSVKSNIGHTLETAGLAGVLKAILSIKHGVIPPSINVEQLSSSIPWNEIPLVVPKSCQAWPVLPAGQPRRAAVNAFGIGGLNVHVIVEQPSVSAPPPQVVHPSTKASLTQSVRQPIAVIGRGLVVPGALDVAAFAHKLSQHIVSLSQPPAHRWRRPAFQSSPADRMDVLAGFITDYQYDWRKHKVPPKQIAQANPLQFMLLEAAEQALREAGYLEKGWNRERAAVVVGSVFGAEFGNALYAGLRLPEFQRELRRSLQDQGASPALINDILTHYESHFLKTFPALLDETGSFTSSTLASRLSKTFDLMGGAMAVDAGEASGLAALDAGIGLLRTGTVDYVLCATGHSALDRASLERLSLTGRLVDRATYLNTDPQDRAGLMQFIPAEGVALVLLKRLNDARAEGDTIHATIHDIAAARLPSLTSSDPASSLNTVAASLQSPRAVSASSIPTQSMRTIGNLQGAQGLVDLIEVSLKATPAAEVSLVAQQATSGLYYCAAVEAGAPMAAVQKPTATPISVPDIATASAVAVPSSTPSPISRASAPTIVRLFASDRQQLARKLDELAQQSWSQVLSQSTQDFASAPHWRAALVATPEDIGTKARLLSSQLGQTSSLVPLAEQGLYWSEPNMRQGKVAWLFPGQGSQYPFMLRDWIASEPAAAAALGQCNAALARLKEQSFEELAWSEQSQLGENVWHTQSCMLVSDWIMMRSLQSHGLQPHVVAGHSFGEFAAMLAAGCWDLNTALTATWYRCRAIVEHVPAACGMLSIQATPQTVQQLIDASHIPVHISHRNAPEQTVVGGKQAAVAQFAQIIDNEGLASRLLAVPTAFHTPALSASQQPFANALQTLPIMPPRIDLLSSVNNRYATDPVSIRAGLAAQLVTQLNYVELVEQLIADGVRVVVEVGPSQVLTRLTRQIAGSRLTVLSTDHPKRGTAYQMLSARAGLEVMTTSIEQEPATMSAANTPLHFDATAVRRERMRQAALHGPTTSVTSAATKPMAAPAVVQFDASQLRRERNRHSASAPTESRLAESALAESALPENTPSRASESIPATARFTAAPAQPPFPQATTAPTAPHPIHVSSVVASVAPATSSTVEQVKVIETFLIDFVVEQTGYPAEIIELDWDIEADLGIDSIKKAQLFGELREFFDLESLTSFSLDSFKTLRDIVNLLVTLPGKGDWLARAGHDTTAWQSPAQTSAPVTTPTASTPAPGPGSMPSPPSVVVPTSPAFPTTNSIENVLATPTTDFHAAATPPAASSTDSSSVAASSTVSSSTVSSSSASAHTAMSSERMQQFLIDFVVEQTGYPPEIVDMDSDLEADLGIDSIKKAQLFGELREMFTFPTATTAENNRLALSEFRTLRSVLDLLQGSQASAKSDDPATLSSNAIAATSPAPVHQTEAQPSANQHIANQPTVSQQTVADQNVLDQSQWMQTGQRPSHEFRSLKPWPVPATPFTLLNELPVAYFAAATDGRAYTVVPGHHYMAAVFANLQAMVGRSNSAMADHAPYYNGQREQVSQAVAQLATAVGAADVSLLALDAAVLQASAWRPISSDNRSTDPLHIRQPNSHPSSALRAIAEYHAPAWLTHGSGVPLGAHVSSGATGTHVQWLTPGCVTSMAFNHAGKLLVGGLHGQPSSLHDAMQLQTWLKHQTSVDVPAFEKAARQLRFANDWWAMLVDLSTAERILVECRQGVIVIEQGALPIAQASAAACAGFYLDTSSGELVVRTQLKPRPYIADEARLSIPSHSDVLSKQAAPETASVAVERPAAISAAADHAPLQELTKRFVLRMAPAPQRVAAGRRPTWSGAALIIGDNPVAIQLEARLRSAKVPVTRWAGSQDPQALATRFDELIKTQKVRHLFLTTPCDTAAVSTLDRAAWQQRRNVGMMSLYWLCQRWYQHILASGWVDDASLVAVTSLGGDFGIASRVPSIEGGALSGLLKAILIESWVQGFRTFPIKVIDTCQQDSPAQIANNIWQELAVPSFDVEVGYCQGERHVVRAIARPLSDHAAPSVASVRPITPGGTWVCTGGARGITAFVAEQLAIKYGLKLHLIGTQPLPTIQESWRHLDDASLRELKAQIMTEARAAGLNPVTTWQDTEKALEIDRNLRKFKQAGIEVHYHSCDVADRDQVALALQRVRELSGPIHGVLHGAGVGKDSRFDRKQPDKVRQCIGAKVDGAWSLIEATWQDPLEAFVGFGSISGRFGANGHTDYSLANDMLCKQMDWLRSARPEVHAVGFHWHAWDDVGMATKPETKLALEMIQMQFMPAFEGAQHLLRELASDSRESEVLITDDRYYRLFYAPEALVDNAGRSIAHLPPATPLIQTDASQRGLRIQEHTTYFQPAKDPFLTDHKLDDRPLLPIVIGTELMLEAARAHLGHMQPLRLHSVRAVQGLRFYSDAPQTARLTTSTRDDGGVFCQLLSDFHARDGRLVQRDRLNMSAVVDVLDRPTSPVTHVSLPIGTSMHRPAYPAPGSKFYVGAPLQRLRGFAISGDGLVGKITAPALIELAGGARDVRGWQLPSSAVDACLFAAGILAWQTVAPGSALPTGFGEIEIGRLPGAGEACEVHVRLREAKPGEGTAPAQAAFDFTLYGVDRDVLVNVRDYRVAWLVDTSAQVQTTTASARR